MKLGKAKYSGEKKEVFKIKDGDNVFRILPPMGKLADAGVYSRYYKVVWGFKDSSGKLKPFISPRVVNFKTKMVDVDCAATNFIFAKKEELKAATEQAKEFAKNKQPIPAELKKQLEDLKELVGQKGRFNIDSKHHLNALSQDGKIGLLKLVGRGMQALRAEFKSLEAANVDATGVEGGRFMVIHREGTGLDTAYSAKELKEQVQTAEYGLVERPLPHDLTESIISRLAAEAYELDEIYPAPSEAEVAEIVAAFERSEEEGAQAVDRILGGSSEASEETASNVQAETKVEQRAEAVKEAVQTSVSEEVASSQKIVQENSTVVEVNTSTGEILNETPVEKQEVAAQAQTIETVSAPVQNAAAQSDADFLAELGVKL